MTRFRSALIAAAVALAAAAEPALAADYSPELQALIKAADAEGTLKLVWTPGAIGGARGAKGIEDGMNKMFGTKIEVRFAPGGSMPQVGNQLAAENKAGRPATTDMYITSLNNAAVLAPLGIFRKVEWTRLLPGRITDEMIEADGVALRYVTTLTHFAYNTNLLPDPPKTLEGFLDPKFKGKLATTPYAAGWDAMGASDVWGLKKTVDFARALSGQISGLINCGDENRIASGEFVAMIFTCGGGARVLVEKGAPLALKVPADMVSTGFFYLMVPRNATSPNAATLATVYLMTDEGQKFSWEVWRDDLHLFPGSNMAGLLQVALVGSGGKMTLQTIKWAQEHPEKDEALAAVTDIFQTSGKN